MTRLLIGGSVLVMLAASVAVYATIPGSDGKIHVCLNPAGQVRVIDADRAQSCRPAETALEWPAALPAAPICPAGTTLFLGVCFETATRFGDWSAAVNGCADEGRRLPTHTELLAFRRAHRDVTTEWTDHVMESQALAVVTSGLSGNTFFEPRTGDNIHDFRCVVPL
jgi:hypothetical protein